VIKAFSFVDNFKKLMKVNDSEEKSLWSLNGIRVMAIVLVLIGHFYSTARLAVVHNLIYMGDLFQNAPLLPIVMNATFAVAAFFFLSGFLTFYLLTSKLYPSKTSFGMVYLHWYIRLFPLMLSAILFAVYIFPYIGSGANWASVNA